MEREHIVKQYDTELNGIRSKLLEMGGKVEAMISNSVKALVDRDTELADRTIEFDHEINHLEMVIDEKCLEVLARRLRPDRDPGQLLRLLPKQQRRLASDPRGEGNELVRGTVERCKALDERRGVDSGKQGRVTQHLSSRCLPSGKVRRPGVQRPRRRVDRDRPPLAIEDQPARWADRLDLDTILIRTSAVLLVVGHLQMNHPRDQHEDREQSEQEQRNDTARKIALFAIRILDMGRSNHRVQAR